MLIEDGRAVRDLIVNPAREDVSKHIYKEGENREKRRNFVSQSSERKTC